MIDMLRLIGYEKDVVFLKLLDKSCLQVFLLGEFSEKVVILIEMR